MKFRRSSAGQLAAAITTPIRCIPDARMGHRVKTDRDIRWSPNGTSPHITEMTAEKTTEKTLSQDEEKIDWDNRRMANAFTFSQFWSRYPRKEAKQDAMAAWQKLSPSVDLANTILDAVEAQMNNNWQSREKQYIPLPASWIRGKRWEDEIVPHTNGRKIALYDKDGNFTVEGSIARARGEI